MIIKLEKKRQVINEGKRGSRSRAQKKPDRVGGKSIKTPTFERKKLQSRPREEKINSLGTAALKDCKINHRRSRRRSGGMTANQREGAKRTSHEQQRKGNGPQAVKQ